MRYYGIERKKYIEKVNYDLAKCKDFASQYTTFNKERRKQKKIRYNTNFFSLYRVGKIDCSIPKEKYYIPVCIITSDLVLRENIAQLQSGLIKLLKKHYSHKSYGVQMSIDEIIKNIEKMDNILTSRIEEMNIGRIDFEGDRILKQEISYCDIYIKNMNSSYLSVEFHLYVSEHYVEKLTNIINNDYVSAKGYSVRCFTKNGRISGGKETHEVCYSNNAHLKSDILYENILMLKWLFYEKIQKYFFTILHKKNINPPSVNIYKTNISYTEKNTCNFWESVGISSFHGQFIDNFHKLFFETKLSGRYECKERTDLIYIVNDLFINKSSMYYSLDFQIVSEFEESLSTSIFKFTFLEALNYSFGKEVIKYKTQFNKIKLKKSQLKELLKLRYFYERKKDDYRRYVCDDIWEKAQNNISEKFDNKKPKNSYDYSTLTESVILSKDNIIEQTNVLSNEFINKIAIIQHLNAYKNEKQNKTLNCIALIVAIATLIFIIFPELIKYVRTYIISIAEIVTSMLK